MKIVVCVKLAPDASDIQVRNDGSISLERAEWSIGSFDLQAIEAGMRLAETTGGTVIALSVGPARINNSKLRKDLLSRGPNELVLVADDSLTDADTHVTAQVLAAAIRKIGGVDVILTGEGSADNYFQQVGLQVGEILGWPTFNAISRIEPGGSALQIERSLEDETEVLLMDLPLVLAVTTDIHTPRLPNMKSILDAARKPVSEWNISSFDTSSLFEPKIHIVALHAPKPVERKQIMVEGTPDEAARTLAGYLRMEGVI